MKLTSLNTLGVIQTLDIILFFFSALFSQMVSRITHSVEPFTFTEVRRSIIVQ